MKSKLKGAEQGHSLLKRKSEALTKYAALDPCAPQYQANKLASQTFPRYEYAPHDV